jgi:hypothetical protein
MRATTVKAHGQVMTCTSSEAVVPSLSGPAHPLARTIVIALTAAAILLAVVTLAVHSGDRSPVAGAGPAAATAAQGPPASVEVLEQMHCPAFPPR